MSQKPYIVSDYINKLCRQVCGEKSLERVASDVQTIHPGNETFHPKAIYLEEEISRITGVGLSGTIKSEMARIQEHSQVHGATKSYHLKNILLNQGNLYSLGFKYGVNTYTKLLLDIGTTEIYEPETILSQTWLGSKFFGHYMVDEMPLNILANTLGTASGFDRTLTGQQHDYASILNNKLNLLPQKAYLSNITIVDDYHYNEHKKARWESIRNKLISYGTNTEHTGVFLMRGNTGEARTLTNEKEVAGMLSKLGFKCINPGTATAEEVIKTVSNAKVVIGVEGSHLSHGFLGIAQRGTMLVLQPPMRFSAVYKERCDIIGINFAFHVCEATNGGFKANVESLTRLIDKIS